MLGDKFWLYEWLDIYEVHKIADAKEILRHAAPREGLRELVAQIPYTTEEISVSDAPTIVAGRAIDLSGELDCYAWECMKKQVDKLFSHVWHYFDRIVVVGPSAHEFSSSWNEETEPEIIERLLTYIRLLLYIREVGAEDLIIFREKFPACELHLEKHLKEVDLQPASMLADNLIDQISSKATIHTELHNDHLDYTFTHPEFEHTVWGAVSKSDAHSEKALTHSVTTSVYKRYLAHLASDIRTSKILNSPLGSTVNFHGQLLKAFKSGVEEAEVAFQLDLPILRNIKPTDLLKIRQDENLHFEQFRRSLQIAIKERLENASSERADAIAVQIQRDVIEPKLNEIERRLSAAKGILAKKAGLSLVLGGLATACGLLTANPLMTTTGVTTAIGGALNAEYKFIEEQRDINLSDMYFLWKAQKHSKKHKQS